MKIYKSRVDWWLMAIVFGALGFPIIMGILEDDYTIVGVFAIVNIIILLLFRSIQYKIIDEQLIIWQERIAIKTIRKVYKSRNPLSSPALSLNRIAIAYNTYDEVLISPENQQDFINELLLVNPNIEVEV